MAERIKYQLTDEEVEILEDAIRMLHLGNHPREVANILAVSLPTLYNWHTRWCTDGLEGLVNRPKSGRPRKANEEYCRVLEETISKEPPEQGYAFTIWTVQRLREHLEKETGIDLSTSRFQILLKEKGYRYRRPKHDLHHLQDPTAKAQAREMLEELKKGSAETISGYSLWTKQP